MPIFKEVSQQMMDDEVSRAQDINVHDNVSLLGTFAEAAQLSLREGVTGSLINIGEYNMAEQSELAEKIPFDEANSKYGLDGTSYAFTENDIVNSEVASLRQQRMFNSESYALYMEKAKEKYGTMASVTEFFGGMTGGFMDPIGIAAGTGVSKLVGTVAKSGWAAMTASMPELANAYTMSSVLGTSKGATTIGNFLRFSGNVAEATAGISAVDAPILKVHKDKYGEEFNTKHFMSMVLGGGLLGGTFNFVTHAATNKLAKTFGSNAEEILKMQSQVTDAADKMGVKVNENFAIEYHKALVETPRSGQEPYAYRPIIDNQEVFARDWYAAVDDSGKFHKDVDMGTGTITLTDHYNRIENSIVALDGSGDASKYTLHKMELLPNQKFMPNSGPELDMFKGALVENIRSTVDLPKNIINKFKEVDDLADLSDLVDAYFGEGSDILFHKTMADLGYNGYRMTAKGADGTSAYNAIVLLDKSAFKGEAVPKAVSFEGFKVTESKRLSNIDPNDPGNAAAKKAVQEVIEREINRLQDPKQLVGNEPNVTSPEVIKQIDERVAVTEEAELQSKVDSYVEANKKPEQPKQKPEIGEGMKKEQVDPLKQKKDSISEMESPVEKIDAIMKDTDLYSDLIKNLNACMVGGR